MRTETLEVNGVSYLVKIHYESRDNSSISIGKKAINIRVPSSLSREEQFKRILKMKSWAREKLIQNPKRFKPKAERMYSDGETLKVGDKEYKLDISFKDKQSSSARLIGNIIQLVISLNLSKEKKQNHISSLLSRCIAKERLPVLKRKIHELNEKHFKQRINKIFFKHNKSNWGSCSKAGNINISTRLLFAPDSVLEYVCLHELAHLIEHNHSDKFWSLVREAIPDYKEKEQWLKNNRDKCRL